MTMIDEKLVEAAAIALGRIDGIELPWIADKAGAYWHDYKVRAELAITAYEAAKAQTLALLVTPDRGRRVEHTVPAKPVAEPVAGCLLKAIETLPDDFTDDGNCCAGRLSAPASKDGPDALRPD